MSIPNSLTLKSTERELQIEFALVSKKKKAHTQFLSL